MGGEGNHLTWNNLFSKWKLVTTVVHSLSLLSNIFHSIAELRNEKESACIRGPLGPRSQRIRVHFLLPDALLNYTQSNMTKLKIFLLTQGQQHLPTSQSSANCKQVVIMYKEQKVLRTCDLK